MLAALLLVFVPSEKKGIVRYVALVASIAMFAISVYVFVAYKTSNTEQFSFLIRYNWIENVGILKENGISLSLGVDGISAVMILLNGVVTLAGTLISWKIEHKNKD